MFVFYEEINKSLADFRTRGFLSHHLSKSIFFPIEWANYTQIKSFVGEVMPQNQVFEGMKPHGLEIVSI